LTILQIIVKFQRKIIGGTLNIAVFASGTGSNFIAILDAIESGNIQNTRIVLAISNNHDAGALAIARDHDIPALHLNRKQFDSGEAFNNVLLTTLSRYEVNFIVLAGYMKKLDSLVIRHYKNRIVNIHPALLPAFGGEGMYGMHVHEAVVASKVRSSGATVHIVDEEYDHGPIVIQKSVEVTVNETPESLAQKVRAIEHEIYPAAIRLFAEGKVIVNDRQVILAN
jgi:formyltetrahydrofolate-dependent phosphoribosylglycinamide formyltransferase